MDDPVSAEIAEAVELLFLAESVRLFGYALTLPGVSRFDAEDLVQQTFYAAAESWDTVLAPLDAESRRRWLHRVLRNRNIDQWRRGPALRQVSLEHACEIPDMARDTDRDALNSVVLQRCWDRMRRMPPMRQRVASLKWGEDLSSTEIAALLGITPSTVRGHLKMARDELRDEIGAEITFIAEVDTDEDTLR